MHALRELGANDKVYLRFKLIFLERFDCVEEKEKVTALTMRCDNALTQLYQEYAETLRGLSRGKFVHRSTFAIAFHHGIDKYAGDLLKVDRPSSLIVAVARACAITESDNMGRAYRRALSSITTAPRSQRKV